MAIVIVWLILVGVYFLAWKIKEENLKEQLKDYDKSKISQGKLMTKTRGKSKTEIMEGIVKGEYDKDSQWKL